MGNAQRLFDLHGEKLRYISETKSWLIWNGDSWQWDVSGAQVRELAAGLARSIYAEGAGFDMREAEHFAKWARDSMSCQKVDAAISLLSDRGRIRLSLTQIDADPWLVGFDQARQGIDLRTGKARPTTPADYLTKSLAPCTLGDPAKAVRWYAFLEQIFSGDLELIDWLQRWCGYLLTGKISEQIFGILHFSVYTLRNYQ